MADLTPKQEKALVALLAYPTVTAASEATGIAERTLYTWMQDTTFSEAYRDMRRKAAQQAIDSTFGAAGKAAQTLAALLDSPKEHIRFAAAKTILEQTTKMLELHDLMRRIEVIEKAQQQ